MFYFLKRVGSNYGVIDDEDGVIDWLSHDELKSFLAEGGEIKGISKDMSKLTPVLVDVPARMCNWENGTNIFMNAKGFDVYFGDKFVLHTAHKKFKGKISIPSSGVYALEFNVGVRVQLSAKGYEVLLHCDDQDEKLNALRSLDAFSGDEQVAPVL